MFSRQVGRSTLAGIVVLCAGLSTGALQRRPDPAPKSGVNLTAQLQADFQKRIDEYLGLHKKLEATLPKLPTKDATPQQIDQNQRALEHLLAAERANAKPGDIFGPGMQAFVRSLLSDVFKGARGAQEKKAVFDESHPVRPVINKRYPDDIPLSTMPPRVLENLPKLSDELEYRFVNDDLILLDVHAHIIVDYVLNALPVAPPGTLK